MKGFLHVSQVRTDNTGQGPNNLITEKKLPSQFHFADSIYFSFFTFSAINRFPAHLIDRIC